MTEPGWFPDPLGGPGNRYWNGHDWEAAPAAEDFPEEHHQEKQSKTRLLITVLVGLVGLMGGMLLMLLWPKSEPPESSTPTPGASPTAAPTMTTPTGVPSESVAATVRESMQRDIDNDPELGKLGLRVVDVNLVHKSGNEYKGIAIVKTRDGVTHDVSVEVTADGAGVLWETPPGAFAFAKDEPPPAPRLPPRRLPPPAPPVVPPDYEDFTICPSGLTGVASEDTSCAFADNVRRAWYSTLGAATLSVYSPITRQEYTMRCVPATTTAWPNAKRCAGENAAGASLVVYIS